MADTVNEGTTSYLTVSFYNKSGVLAVPTSAKYRIDCKTNNQAIKAETAFAPIASEYEVEITATENALISQVNAYEKRVVTVLASYGVGDEVNDEYVYYVKNLWKVPSV